MFLAGLALLGAVSARAGEAEPDRVALELRDGRVLEGRLVGESDEAVQLEIQSAGGITGRLDVPRADIRTTRRPGADPAAVERSERALVARALPDPAQRAQALVRLAEEEAARGDPTAAAGLFLAAGEEDPALADQTDVAAARAWLAAGEPLQAEGVVTRALERNPKNAQAQAAAREVAAGGEARARELLEPGIAAWGRGDTRGALRLLVRAVEALPARALEQASRRVQEEAGLTLAQVMIDCRLRTSCEACEGDGVLDCPLAGSNNASTRCRLGLRTSVLRPEKILGVDVARRSRCERCDGVGTLTCEACDGLGLRLTRPTRYEQEAWVETLQGELTGLQQSADALLPRVEQGAERTRGANSEAVVTARLGELMSVLQRLRAYSRSLARLDPRAGAVGGGDLWRRAQAASERMATLLGTVSGVLYLLGEKRYEDAVTQDRDVPPGLRSVRARQAWELVHQARSYTVEALRLHPASAGLLGGDLERRKSLMDSFLRRTWRTYAGLRLAEEGTARGSEQERALRQVLGSGAGEVVGDTADALMGGSAREKRK
jgi:tetratricopeptide (TPR) repeat protein